MAHIQPKTEDEIEQMSFKIGKNIIIFLEPMFVLSKVKSNKKRITNTDSKVFKLTPINKKFCEPNINDFFQIEDHF